MFAYIFSHVHFNKGNLMSRLLKKKIYIYIPYTLFSWLLPDVVAFPEILKQFIM